MALCYNDIILIAVPPPRRVVDWTPPTGFIFIAATAAIYPGPVGLSSTTTGLER